MSFKLLFRDRYGLFFVFSFIACVVLLMGPYYYFLGQQQYIPKGNPDLGYIMPRTVEAWLCLGFALTFLGLAFVAFAQFYRHIHKKGLVLVPQI
jgi:hypothetical protein